MLFHRNSTNRNLVNRNSINRNPFPRKSLLGEAVIGILSAILFMTAFPAVAQAESEKMLEEIIVTARKREESLQNVPTSVSVLSSEDLDARGAANIDAVGQIAPNVHFENAQPTSGIKSPTVFIRGMGQADFIIVGRGIYQADNPALAAEKYMSDMNIDD